MSDFKKHILWEEGMTHEDFLIRKFFYEGTAKPKRIPNNTHFEPIEDIFYVSESDYEYITGVSCPTSIYSLEYGETYPSIDEGLLKYSLSGLKCEKV